MTAIANRLPAALLPLALLALLALVAACGDGDAPALEPLPPHARVLAFGDSLTAGVGAPEGQSYPEQLARLTGLDVSASGVPGETSSRGLARLPRVLERLRPALVILCHGGNDLLRGLSEAATEANLLAMIDLARARGAQVLLVGVPNPGLRLSTADLYARVAAKARVPLEDHALADILSDPALKTDPVHPNAPGYAQLARAVAALLPGAAPSGQ